MNSAYVTRKEIARDLGIDPKTLRRRLRESGILPGKGLIPAEKVKEIKRKIFEDIDLTSQGALIDTEILAKAKSKGYTITEVGVNHYPRTAGSQTGAKMSVIVKAFKELYRLRNSLNNILIILL